MFCLFEFKVDFAYAKEEYVFHSSPETYPKSIQEGIESANKYVSRRLLVCNKEKPFFTEWINYRVVENGKELSGKAYLNNLYKFDETSQDKRLPDSLKNKPLSNNIMENLLDKGFFSIVYQYPLEDWKGKEPRYLGRSIWGQRFSNIYFPPDSTSSTTYIEEKNWVENPWEDEYIYKHFGVVKDQFHQESILTDPNYQKRLEKLIIKGIEYKIDKVAEDAKKNGHNNYFRSKNEGYKTWGMTCTGSTGWLSYSLRPNTPGAGDNLPYIRRQILVYGHVYSSDTLVDLNMLLELEDEYTVIMDDEKTEKNM